MIRVEEKEGKEERGQNNSCEKAKEFFFFGGDGGKQTFFPGGRGGRQTKKGIGVPGDSSITLILPGKIIGPGVGLTRFFCFSLYVIGLFYIVLLGNQ